MDEPFKGLDEDTKNKCIELLKKVSKTAILITHSTKEAENLCKNIFKINDNFTSCKKFWEEKDRGC